MIDNGEYPNTAEGRKRAAGHCYSLYDTWKDKQSKSANAVDFDSIAPFQFNSSTLDDKVQKAIMSDVKMGVIEETDEFVKVRLIAAVGNIFFQNVFVPEAPVEASTAQWDNTWHDISHLATKFPAGFSFTENLDYLLGYNTEVEYNPETKALSMSAVIRKDAPKYKTWRNYIEICKASGKIPNVSIFTLVKYEAMKASELPSGVIVPNDAVVNGYVLSVKEFIEPLAVTTCLLGKCDDTKGCGIRMESTQCSDGTCGVSLEETDIVNTDDKDSEKKTYYLKRIKQLKKGD